MGIEALTGVVATNATGLLKQAVRRREPVGEEPSDESFTSAHAILPFAGAALVRRNTGQLGWPRRGTGAVNAAALISASGSAWGRVEMGLHYPSDQLAGAAIGNFLALFIHDLFMGLEDGGVGVRVAPGGAMLTWRVRH